MPLENSPPPTMTSVNETKTLLASGGRNVAVTILTGDNRLTTSQEKNMGKQLEGEA
jgi:hypothetical protein